MSRRRRSQDYYDNGYDNGYGRCDANSYGDPTNQYNQGYNQQGPVQYGTTQGYVNPQVEEYITLPSRGYNELSHRHPKPYEDPYAQQQPYQQYVPRQMDNQPPMQQMLAPPTPQLPSRASTSDLLEKEYKANGSFYPQIGEKEPRCMYGCIPTKRRTRFICIGIVVLVLIILGVVGFFFYPKYSFN